MGNLILVTPILYVLGAMTGLATGGEIKRVGQLLVLVIVGVIGLLAILFGLALLADFGGWVAVVFAIGSLGLAVAFYGWRGTRAVRSKGRTPAIHLAGASGSLIIVGLLYLAAGYYAAFLGLFFIILGSVAAALSLLAGSAPESRRTFRNAALVIIAAFWVLTGGVLLVSGDTADAIIGGVLLVSAAGLLLASFPQVIHRLSAPTPS